ncbi:MAG: YbhB/YbcL family Raf kinase inhibitor-like protein [Acidobacteriota bacterium]
MNALTSFLWLFGLAWGALAFVALSRGSEFSLSSPRFDAGQPIPRVHTCDGEDRSPALTWTHVPPGTRAFALLCDDPDAPMGTWDHWVIYNIPGSATGLAEGLAAAERLPDGSLQGVNSWGRIGYGGPCPPPGKAHRYYFRLFALDAPLALGAGATKAQVLAAMKGHTLATAEMMGTYER